MTFRPHIPACNHMFKGSNRNTRTRCEMRFKLTRKTPERHCWRRSGVFIVNFELISHLVLVFLLLTLSRKKEGWDRSWNVFIAFLNIANAIKKFVQYQALFPGSIFRGIGNVLNPFQASVSFYVPLRPYRW